MSENIKIIDKRVKSSDGVHELVGRSYVPEGKVRGFFQVVHGMTEHIARYDALMRSIASAGFITFGYDHLGHGKTALNDDELGFISHKNGWSHLVDDVDIFASSVRKEYGESLPYVLMGHSMGSFVVRLTAAKYNKHDKLIVMGTGGPNPAAGAGLALISIIKAFKGEKHISKTVYSVAFGKYNERFSSENDIYAWLTKNVGEREKYAADKFCTFKFTVSAMGDLITLNKKSNDKKWAGSLDKSKLVLLVSGTDDPVGEYGKGVEKVRFMLASAGINVEMKLYKDCRHEILNDTCRDAVIEDILKFID